ncbi:conjugal transfer protein [Streptomyces sp. NBC_01275]|uniref:conjugal transfer protein n=1 Tax=Streptomyces sp. NBC_01275 TaxID=2903807 RepID=UPI002259E85E|nr:conjugal transfer protein [Streptomyces sp. NBC_01275]MCX4763803.1 conjugal transfer protein [Streptomyces sp. NBC_01275]
MAVPPQGDAPQYGGAAGQQPGGQGQGQGLGQGSGRQQVPALTEEMLIRNSGGGKGRSRGSLRRKKPADPPAPPNPWLDAAGSAPGSASNAQRAAPAPESGSGPGSASGDGGKGKKGKRSGQAEAPTGNGWFHNPFAKPKTASSAADRSNVSSAQMWAGPRRGILLRRMLGLFAVLLLLFLFSKVNGKASKAEVQAEVDARLKSSAEDFPRGSAVLWSAPLVKIFATYDVQHTDERSRALQPYAINGIDQQLGWNGQGKQTVIDLVMSDDVQVSGKNNAVVRATVQVQDGSWRCVAVPVYTVVRGGSTAFGLTAAPVYVPCAGLTSPPQDTASNQVSNDSALSETLKTDLLPPFLAAWAQSDTVNLDRYLLPGTVSFGLGGAYMGSGEGGRPTVDSVYVPSANAGSGVSAGRRTVTFTTTLLSTDGKAEQTSMYRVVIVKKNGQWYFASDPTPAVGANGGDQVPNVQPSEGTGDMYSQSPAPYPSATTSTDVQQPTPSASSTP